MRSLHDIVHSKIAKNAFALEIIQVANYLIPLITVPLITRAFGVELFGKVSYAQNILMYFGILVTFGFEYSATRDVVLNRHNPQALNSIFYTIVKWRILLFLFSLLCIGGLYFCFKPVHEDLLLYFLCALLNFSIIFYPFFFLQGMEDMVKMSILNFLAKFIVVVGIIFFIHSQKDYLLYVALMAIACTITNLIAFFYTKKRYHLAYRLAIPTFDFTIIRRAFPVVCSSFINTLYAVSGIVIMGIYLTDIDVGIYSGSYKIITVLIQVFSIPVTQTIFPRMCQLFEEDKARGWHWFKMMFLLTIGIGIIVAIVIYFFAPWAVTLFLSKIFYDSIPQVQMMCVLPTFVMLANLCTIVGLYALKMQRYVPPILLLAGLTSTIICITTISTLHSVANIIGWYVAEVVELCCSGVLFYYHIHKLLRV